MTFSILKVTKLWRCISLALFISFAPFLLLSNSAPTSTISVVCPDDVTVGIYGNSCSATIQLPLPQVNMQNCSGNPSFFVSSAFGVGLGPHADVPAGTYKVNYRVVSPCGDTAMCWNYVTIKDKKNPMPILVSALYANILETGQVSIGAWQFNQGSFDNCSPKSSLRYSFSANPSDTTRVFSCADIGMSNIAITVWDAEGNSAVKVTKLGLLDNEGYCAEHKLKGKIGLQSGEGLQDVEVQLQGAGVLTEIVTDAKGDFELEDLDVQASYAIEPYKDDDYLYGINTFDLYRLHRHLIGEEPFTNPYQYIAADANRDGHVSVSDLLLLQECILGVHPKFPNNTSWRFVDKNYTFQNSFYPLWEQFPECIVSTPTNGVRNVEFVAVKVGDLDNSVSLKAKKIAEERIDAPQISIEHVSPNKLALKLDIPSHILAFDGLISLSELPIRFTEVASNNPSLKMALVSNNLKISWYHDGAQLLQTFIYLTTPSNTVSIREGMLSLSDAQTMALGKEGIMYQATFNFTPNPITPAVPNLRILPNSPNPFMEFTMLPFNVDISTDILVRIFDATGQVVHEIPSTFYEAGEHRILLRREMLNEPGLYTCQFESKAGIATRKLMLL